MELLIPSGPKGALQALQGDREDTQHLPKSCCLCRKVQHTSRSGSTAQQRRLLAQEMRDTHALAPLQALLSHLALTWAEACGRCLNQNMKSRDVVLTHTSCFCTKEEGITPKVQQSSPG